MDNKDTLKQQTTLPPSQIHLDQINVQSSLKNLPDDQQEIDQMKLRTEMNLQTDQELHGQEQQEQADQESSSRLNQLKKKKRTLFIVIISGALLLILAGVLIGVLLGRKDNQDNSENELEKEQEHKEEEEEYGFFKTKNVKITVPKNYEKFKESILAGQEKNILKLIYTPESQKFYDYIISTDSTIITASGTQKSSSSLVHSFSIFCDSINDEGFDLFLYFIESKTYENDKQISFLPGYPGIIDINNSLSKRFLDSSFGDNADFQRLERIVIQNQHPLRKHFYLKLFQYFDNFYLLIQIYQINSELFI